MSAIAWNTVYPCMFRPPLTAKKQENGHLKKRSPTRIAGRCQVAGGRFAATCFILHRFQPLGSHPQYGAEPGPHFRADCYPCRHTGTKPAHGVSSRWRGTDASSAAKRPTGAHSGPTGRYQAGHICGVSIAVISDSISAANSSRDCPYFSRQYWPILSRIALFSSALSW